LPDIWVATSYGALDIRDLAFTAGTSIEFMLVPTQPSEPIGLQGDVAQLWRRLVAEPVPEADLSADQKTLVREFEEAGIASRDPHHPARTISVPQPWLSSPLHELVYSLVAYVAREVRVEVVFIKGPALHRQGLREREHSGDVDVWVDPDGIEKLRDSLSKWGWNVVPTLWGGHPPSHSMALRPETWGCEIDLHHDFPGIDISGKEAFALLREQGEQLDFAGTVVTVPVRAAHALIFALHITRPQAGRPTPRLPEDLVAKSLRHAGTGALGLARRLRADAALAPVLGAAFPLEFEAPGYDAPLNWRWRAQPSLIQSYAMALRMVPAAERPRVLFRLVWPEKAIAFAVDNAVEGRPRTAFGARCHRLLRILRQVITDAEPHRHPGAA
jgi:hypothetical protein